MTDLIRMNMYLTIICSVFCILKGGDGDYRALSNSPLSYLSAVAEYVHAHSDSAFALTDLEDIFGISKFRLCREYKEAFGISLLQDLNKTRIEKAKKLLVTTDMQIQEVSRAVGFESVNHFINLFKRMCGTTPGKFRL